MARIPAAQRRKEFVDAAVRVIAEHGMPDATTRRIAEAAGAPLASLHYCFHSKDELFAAVFETQAAMLNERIGPAAPGAGLAAVAARTLRESIRWFQENRERVLASVELELWAWRQDDGWAAKSYGVHIAPLTTNLRRACRPDDDESLVEPGARMISVLFDGLFLQWCAYRDDDQLMEDTEHACEMLRQYLAPREAPKPRKRRSG